jgi:hypothetical protein
LPELALFDDFFFINARAATGYKDRRADTKHKRGLLQVHMINQGSKRGDV